MEHKLLSVILHDRKAYNEIKETLDEQDFSDVARLLLEEMIDFYSRDADAKSVDNDIILSRLERKYPDHYATLQTALETLEPVSVPNVLSEYVDIRIHAIGRRLAAAISSGSSSTLDLIREYEYLSEKREEALSGDSKDERIFIGVDIDDLFEELSDENLIQLFPSSLNDELDGGVPRGTHIVIFARPETGKSMFSINLTAELLKHGNKVLYIGNEDPAAQMRQRILSSMLGVTRREILAQIDYVRDIAHEEGLDNLVFVPLSPGSVGDVRRLVHRFKPDVFIVDQIRNLHASKNLTRVESLEYIAQEMRNLGKETNSVAISITQAGDSASGKLGLDLGDVDFSNTGIPSTADLMIGVGVDSNYEAMDRRMLSLPKNKISGKHSTIPVDVDTKYSRIRSIG